ncbi:Trafficking protein particle complex subunit 6A [Thelohanellus kitauei]|uniref:Trafficking protein particle complex subunit 6A n=1 Tax=Thelohanellus kitauei TaxID=669202 RepID=A0A0C2M1M0_THEKT|nr:Trafficking protein particle complex subunit 6A [Thelohanellus kitauei]
MGFKVGRILSEKYGFERLNMEKDLDLIKFLCKDIWISLFGKAISSLKTNSDKQFILIDHELPNMKSVDYSLRFTSFVGGIIEGFLINSGLKVMSVETGLMDFPSCYFLVKLFSRFEAGETPRL